MAKKEQNKRGYEGTKKHHKLDEPQNKNLPTERMETLQGEATQSRNRLQGSTIRTAPEVSETEMQALHCTIQVDSTYELIKTRYCEEKRHIYPC